MSSCVAIIPARGGSKGIKDKNLQKIGGISLVGRAVEACFDAKFDEVFILSDSEKIRDEAGKFGANKSYERPSEISHSTSHMFELYKWLFTKMLHDTGSHPLPFAAYSRLHPFGL